MLDVAVNGAAGELPLPASASALMRYQVGRKFDDPELPELPVYKVRIATGALDAAIMLATATAGIVRVTPQVYRDTVLVGLEDAHATRGADGQPLVADEDYERYLTVFEEFIALEPWDPEEGPEPRERKLLAARFRMLSDFVAEISPRYQRLNARAVTNMVREKALVCQHVLAGWEQREGLCVITDHVATAETVAQLTVIEQLAIADCYERSRTLTAEQKKSLRLPSPSPVVPNGSPSASSDPATGRRGKSAAKATPPTLDT